MDTTSSTNSIVVWMHFLNCSHRFQEVCVRFKILLISCRKQEEERLKCQKEVRVQIENVLLTQSAAAPRKQRSQSTGTNVRSRSPCLDIKALNSENSLREDAPSGKSPALLRSRSPTVVASKKSAIAAVSKKSAISRLLDLKLVEAKLSGLVASQGEMPVLNQEEQTILDSIRLHIDKL